jgi:hypothetical protein
MSDSPADRRRHPRISYPFDAFRVGIIDTPLKLYDLSVGGCFVNDFHEPPAPGRTFKIRIELPTDEAVTLRVEAIYGKPGYGYAVRFCETTAGQLASIERALAFIASTE